MTKEELLAKLHEVGFTGARIIESPKGHPYYWLHIAGDRFEGYHTGFIEGISNLDWIYIEALTKLNEEYK